MVLDEHSTSTDIAEHVYGPNVISIDAHLQKAKPRPIIPDTPDRSLMIIPIIFAMAVIGIALLAVLVASASSGGSQ